jgi:hypothetical protein
MRCMQGEIDGDQWLAEWADAGADGTIALSLKLNGHLVGTWQLSLPGVGDRAPHLGEAVDAGLRLYVTVFCSAVVSTLQTVRAWSPAELVAFQRQQGTQQLPPNVVALFPRRSS